MKVLRVKNVHEALPRALHMLRVEGVARESRNGPVIVHPEPVATVYSHPCERVIFHPWRDANPFFHFYESLWMLAGRRDIAPLVRYAKNLASYSDDGVTQNAAYGYRWRRARLDVRNTDDGPYDETQDQLKIIVDELKGNSQSRQAVLQIWDHALDLGTQTKDHACNLTATFQIADRRLNMVVFCRSNDAVWGAYGANAVHFSVLLEYMAGCVGVQVGTCTQVSVNLHAYDATASELYQYGTKQADDVPDPYELEPLYTYPLFGGGNQESWDNDVRRFVTADGRAPDLRPDDFVDPFFRDVALPMVLAHDAWKDNVGEARKSAALDHLSRCRADDWRTACVEWIGRRK